MPLTIPVPVKKTIKARDGVTDVDTEFVEIANPVAGGPQLIQVTATVGGISFSQVITHGAIDDVAKNPTAARLQQNLDDLRADLAEIVVSRSKVKGILPLLK